MVVLLLIASFAVFSLVYLAPGDPLGTLLGGAPRTPQVVGALRREYHLNLSFFHQYWLWLTGAVRLQFGKSVATGEPVIDEIKMALPSSLYLGAYAYLLTMVLGVGFGALAAVRRQQWVDRVLMSGSIVALSMPAFVSGTILIYIFAVLLGLFPASGGGTGFINEIWHLTLPAFALAFMGVGYVAKHTRTAMVGALQQDYVTFARARGLSARRVLLAYALRNALIPVVTIAAVLLGFVVTGAVLIEVAFSLPGIGSLLVQSATEKDITTVQGIAMVIAFIIMAANLLADIAYAIVDPRIRLGGGAR
jgi:peptide/nickel transport system permease protein